MFRRLLAGLGSVKRECGRNSRRDKVLRAPSHVFETLEDRRLLSTLGNIIGDASQWLANVTTTTAPAKPDRAQSSYRKTPATIPGIIQAEYYDRGGEGIAYHDTTPGNQSGSFRGSEGVDVGPCLDTGRGYAVTRTAAREWLEYTVSVPANGYYDFSVRLASLGVGGKFHLEVDRVRKTPNITVPNTGGWQRYQTITITNVPIPAGKHVLRLAMDSVGPRKAVANFNWFQFTAQPPVAPMGFVATPVSAFAVQLDWTDLGLNASNLSIERKAGADGVWSQIALLPGNAASYTDTGLDAATEYFYRIRAINGDIASNYTDEINATTAPADQIVITQGGTYSGQWQSLDPNVPAVLVATTEPVIIQNSLIRGRGNLISTSGGGVNLTVVNTRGYGLNPEVAGMIPGRFVNAEGVVNVDIENSYMEGTSGIYVYDYQGDYSAGQTVKVLKNSAHNIDGRFSDGAGGWLADGELVQFFQMNGIQNLPGVEIGWNQIINDPDDSLVEDNINIYASSGTPTSPIAIHDNYIQGAYALNAAVNADYSGGGIMLSDGGSSYVQAFNNQVISTSNYGIAIASGHDNSFFNNRIISSGLLPTGQAIAAQNVGAYIWNMDSSPVFYNNSGSGNLIGWMKNGQRNDYWTPNASNWSYGAWPGTVSSATEAGEWTFWQNKLATSGVMVGTLT